ARKAIAAEELVGALTGKNDLVSGIPNRATKEIPGSAMGVVLNDLALRDRFREMISKPNLAGVYWLKISERIGCGITSEAALVEIRIIERDRKSAHRDVRHTGRESKYRRGIES